MFELGNILLIIWFLYVVGFMIAGKILERGYFKTNLATEASNIELLLDVFHKAETTSLTMAGFSLTALTFIIAIFYQNLPSVEMLIVFFSIGFIAEVVSAFSYHDTTKGLSAYSGFVFQYAGMLAILSGFFTYLLSNMSYSGYLWLIYCVGIFAFIFLTAREISFFATYWKELSDERNKQQ